jgi:hypothetical protein
MVPTLYYFSSILKNCLLFFLLKLSQCNLRTTFKTITELSPLVHDNCVNSELSPLVHDNCVNSQLSPTSSWCTERKEKNKNNNNNNNNNNNKKRSKNNKSPNVVWET